MLSLSKNWNWVSASVLVCWRRSFSIVNKTRHWSVSIAGYHQESFYWHISIILLLFLSLSLLLLSVVFALGLLAIWSPVLGHTSSVGYGFCLVEWVLSLIRHQLVAPTSSIPSLSGRIYCTSNVWWLSSCLHFSLVACRVCSHTKDSRMCVCVCVCVCVCMYVCMYGGGSV